MTDAKNGSCESASGVPARRLAGLDSLDQPDVWRMLVLFSGLLLAVAFFLPIWKPGLSPANLWRVGLEQWSNPYVPLSDQFHNFCALVAPYLFGGLMAAGAAARLLRRARLAKCFSISLAVLLTAVGLGLLVEPFALEPYESTNAIVITFVTSLLGAAATVAYVISASRVRSAAFVCYEFAGSIALIMWFTFSWPINQFTPYAMLGASIFLLVGTIGEARLTLHRSWRDTEWLLLTCLFSAWRARKQEAIA
jgi:hypothetical protein